MKTSGMVSLSSAAVAFLAVDPSMASQVINKDISPAITGTVSGIKMDVCAQGHHQLWVTTSDDDQASLIISYDLDKSSTINTEMQDGLVTVKNTGGCNTAGGHNTHFSYLTLKLPKTNRLESIEAKDQNNGIFVDSELMGKNMSISAQDTAFIVATMPSDMTDLDISLASSSHLFLNSSSYDNTSSLSTFQITTADSAHAYIGKLSAVDTGSASTSDSSKIWLESTSFSNLTVDTKGSSSIHGSTSADSNDIKATGKGSSKISMCSSVFSGVDVTLEDSCSMDIGVTSNASVSGSAAVSSSLAYYGADVSSTVQNTGSGSVSAGDSCILMEPMPEFPGILRREEMSNGNDWGIHDLDNNGGVSTTASLASSVLLASIVAVVMA